jgi:hypothetical protein
VVGDFIIKRTSREITGRSSHRTRVVETRQRRRSPLLQRAMTMTHVEIGDARPARSPDTKAAIRYLEASGATAISVIETETGCTFHVGTKIEHAAAIFWIIATEAKPIVRQARKLAGPRPDIATTEAALHEAASSLRSTLTPHAAAIQRARKASQKLDGYLESLRWSGKMREFTRAYKQRRMAATASGQGFMTYAVAELRLRQALIPLLVGGRSIGPVRSLFAEIFR